MPRIIPRTGFHHTYNANDLVDFTWSRYSGGGKLIAYTMSGVVITDLLNQAQDWTRDEITVTLPIPALAHGKGIWLQAVVPFFTINAIDNQGTAIQTGYAVDGFQLRGNQPNPQFGQSDITFAVNIALKGMNVFLHRIGFTVTFFGLEKPLPPPVIIK